jgi:4'-phosphopantetheinyl transferase
MTALPAPADLGSTDVHVWLVDTDEDGPPLDALAAALSPEERRRRDRFHHAREARRFGRRRAALRAIVGGYLGLPPAEVALDERCHGCGDWHGKPRLAAPAGHPLRFSLSGSDDLVALALTSGRDVGVDVEWEKPDVDWRLVASRCFTREENSELAAAPAALRAWSFFQTWTRMEAELKCSGAGLGQIGAGPPTTARRSCDDVVVVNLPTTRPLAAGLAVAGCRPVVQLDRWSF